MAYHPGRYERTRLGITVTKKVGKAAVRNKIKRLIREYFRQNRHHITGNWDINLIAKKEAANQESDRILESVRQIFDNLSRSRQH